MNRLLVPAVLLGLLLGASGCDDDEPTGSPSKATSTTSALQDNDSQWVSFRNVEVKAPADWTYDLEPAMPQCIERSSTSTKDQYADDVPDHPYIVVGSQNARPSTFIDCGRSPEPGDPVPDRAFGWVPFGLWQPYVKLAVARTDQGPEGADADLKYQGWHLLRTTVGRIQVTVLSAPGGPDFGPDVVSSLRTVKVTEFGCETEAPALMKHLARPTGNALPPRASVGAVAVCDYSRIKTEPGLEASRLLTGPAAKALVRAIDRAPFSLGRCTAKSLDGDKLALRFYRDADHVAEPLAEAYVYLDTSCSDGIVTTEGRHVITRQNCAPLFSQPPLAIWGGNPTSTPLCHTRERG